MEKGEPALVPEWLRSSGSGSGSGVSGHLFASSSSHSDSSSTRGRTRSSKGVTSFDIIRSNFLDRSSSSNSRRSSNNGFVKNAYSSFSRNHRGKDRDRDKERLNFSGDSWETDSSESLASILSGRNEKDTLRRSHSMITSKHDDFLSGKGMVDFKVNTGDNHANGNGLVHKGVLEKDFPSLGSEERQMADLVRVASPSLTTPVQNLPVGSSVLAGEGWTSALVDSPNTIAGNPTGSSTVVPVVSSSTLHNSSCLSGLNMAEALTQAPARARTSPQPSTQTQRREELAIKQSRQLIPVTPTVPKLSILSSDKVKPKTLVRSSEVTVAAKNVQQVQSVSTTANLSSLGNVKQEPGKVSHGKLYVLKPGWENGVSPKDSTGYANNATRASNVQTPTSSASPLPVRSPNKQRILSGDRKQPAHNLISGLSLDKKPSLSQTQSRNDFFNHLKKKTSTPSSPAVQELSPVSLSQSSNNSSDIKKEAVSAPDSPRVVKDDGELTNNSAKFDDIVKFSEEETAFLRSLGWDENSGEEGLTEEEINSFYEEYMNREPPRKECLGVQQKLLESRSAGINGAASQF